MQCTCFMFVPVRSLPCMGSCELACFQCMHSYRSAGFAFGTRQIVPTRGGIYRMGKKECRPSGNFSQMCRRTVVDNSLSIPSIVADQTVRSANHVMRIPDDHRLQNTSGLAAPLTGQGSWMLQKGSAASSSDRLSART